MWISFNWMTLAIWLMSAVPGNPGQPPAVQPPVSVQQVARAFLSALQRGDVDTARKSVMGFDAFRAISRRGLDPKRHASKHDQFLQSLAAGFRHGLQLDQLTLKDVLFLPTSIKTRHPVVMAVFHAVLRTEGGREGEGQTLALVFVQCQDGWKFMLRD